MSKDIELKFAGKEYSIDVDQVTVRRVKALYKALNEIKDRHNPFKKYPKIEVPDTKKVKDAKGVEIDEPTGSMREEKHEEWRHRVLLSIAGQYSKKDDESEEDFDRRIVRLNLDDHLANLSSQFFNEVCKIFGMPEVTEEQWDDVPLDKARAYCFDVLAIADINDPDGLFFPRKRSSVVERAASE